MTSTGWLSAGTVTDADPVGTGAWTNPDNMRVADGTYGYGYMDATQSGLNQLDFTNFSVPTIPAGQNIYGIQFRYKRYKAGIQNVKAPDLYSVYNGGLYLNYQGTDNGFWETTPTYFTWGKAGSPDVTKAVLASSTFGFRIGSVYLNAAQYNATAYIDAAEINVTYGYAPVVPNRGTDIESAYGASNDITMPTGYSVGDKLECLVYTYDTTATYANTAGWTVTTLMSPSGFRVYQFSKVAASTSETLNVTFSVAVSGYAWTFAFPPTATYTIITANGAASTALTWPQYTSLPGTNDYWFWLAGFSRGYLPFAFSSGGPSYSPGNSYGSNSTFFRTTKYAEMVSSETPSVSGVGTPSYPWGSILIAAQTPQSHPSSFACVIG